jgi:hypothetical protein
MFTIILISIVCALGPLQRGTVAVSELEGELRIRDGSAFLVVEHGEVRLVSESDPVEETLGDRRIAGRRLRLKGTRRPSGEFDVQEFLVVRGDKEFRLVYFCATCNVTSFHPGDCDCCREPTLPMEIPPTDPRVYHPEIRPSPPPK